MTPSSPDPSTLASPCVSTWVVDGANVVGARPDGWWRDRAGAAARLHTRLLALAATVDWPPPAGAVDLTRPGRIVLVLEGAARGGVPATPAETQGERRPGPHVAVVHAPAAGDDAIVAAARDAAPAVLAFTSDRALRARLLKTGADVRGAGALWALLESL